MYRKYLFIIISFQKYSSRDTIPLTHGVQSQASLLANAYGTLCTGGAYYVTYSFRFISNKPWDGGEGKGAFT